ncbi:MAG TPA: PTS sugar transporter subunit IIA [bacterium]|nr:PTS sugar transporter subunit IIA [bacterium]
MKIRKFVKPGLILMDVRANSRSELLHILAERIAAANPSLKVEAIEEALNEREKIGTTAIGHGVALPHARIPEHGEPIVGLARLDTPVDFGATDGERVWLIGFSAVDASESIKHLQILARLSRVLGSPVDRESIGKARTPEEMMGVLTRDDNPWEL